ncbi:MAG TPA: glycosyltransferase, partial [Dongiaceae bacterium]|nr:glycosyltransferase [Dongiaceae bacterium]
DQDNATGSVLQALQTTDWPAESRITVVMGSTAPWLDAVRDIAGTMRCPTQVLTGVDTMAQLMADSDLAIGAAGSTAWERCCLGLPTIMVVLADNQKQVACALARAEAAAILSGPQQIAMDLPPQLKRLQESAQARAAMTRAAADITDGLGVFRVMAQMGSEQNQTARSRR